MALQLLTVHQQLPHWVREGIESYRQRLPHPYNLSVNPLPLGKRSKKTHDQRAIEQEGQAMLAAIPKQAVVIALDEHGKQYTSPELANTLQQWLNQSSQLVFLIGGPDGLAPDVLSRADYQWSLSPLTLPHALAQLLCAEQLYRAYTILNHHPYHRS